MKYNILNYRSWLGILWLALSLAAPTTAGAVTADLSALVAQNRAAVINISTTYITERNGDKPQLDKDNPLYDFFRRYFEDHPDAPEIPQTPREHRRYGGGSGCIISADGYVLTNAHVIKDADEVTVALSDRREFIAEIIGVDMRSDVALLKIKADNLPTVKIGNSDELEVGQWVVAIGSPFGFEYSATQGIISALARSLPDETYVPFIQTDVAVNPGNSGGPLFNLRGEVIGINSQIYSRTGGYMGLSFAIPVNVAMHVMEQLKTQGYVSRGWLGVLIQQVDSDLAHSFGLVKPGGALVAQIIPDSPADDAGFEVGDIILRYNGKPVEIHSDLPNLVGMTKVGESVDVEIMRKSESMTLQVTIGELESEDIHPGERKKAATRNRLGLTVADLSAEEREQYGIEHGVIVKQVHDGPGASAGIRKGDLLLQFNRNEVEDAKHFNELVEAMPIGKPVSMLIQRADGAFFITVEVKEDTPK